MGIIMIYRFFATHFVIIRLRRRNGCRKSLQRGHVCSVAKRRSRLAFWQLTGNRSNSHYRPIAEIEANELSDRRIRGVISCGCFLIRAAGFHCTGPMIRKANHYHVFQRHDLGQWEFAAWVRFISASTCDFIADICADFGPARSM